MKHLKKFNEDIIKENIDLSDDDINYDIDKTDLLNRVNLLLKFLNKLPDETKVSATDIYGYLYGYFGNNDKPEDEIETFE